MAVGKQNETIIVHWHPGETVGYDGLGQANEPLPTDLADVSASGLRSYTDTRVTLLKSKVVASGVVANYTG